MMLTAADLLLLLLGTWLGAVPLLRLAGAQSDYLSLALEYAFPALISLALSGPAIVLHGILTGWATHGMYLLRMCWEME